MSADIIRSAVIQNKLGLHVRPSRALAEIARSFDAKVIVKNGAREAAADSQLDLLMLVAKVGTTLEFTANGPQAEEAVDAMIELIDQKFGEKQ